MDFSPRGLASALSAQPCARTVSLASDDRAGWKAHAPLMKPLFSLSPNFFVSFVLFVDRSQEVTMRLASDDRAVWKAHAPLMEPLFSLSPNFFVSFVLFVDRFP